jgi:antitoxin YefM
MWSSLDDYNSWMETHYLLSNPYNDAERLLNSLKNARSEEVFERELIAE